MKTFSTRQAAQQLGISLTALNRYIGQRKITVPAVTILGTAKVRVWTEDDIQKVRNALPKIANGRKTRYKKQSAVSNQQSVKTKKKTQARVPAPHKKK
jgi:hypothetical protein